MNVPWSVKSIVTNKIHSFRFRKTWFHGIVAEYRFVVVTEYSQMPDNKVQKVETTASTWFGISEMNQMQQLAVIQAMNRVIAFDAPSTEIDSIDYPVK